ncbi:MAG: exostosin domain-containing protein [Jejuia sp.]
MQQINNELTTPKKVYILSAYLKDSSNYAYKYLKECASSKVNLSYELCESPKDADLIMFVEHHPGNDPYFFKVLKHPVYKKYRKKCVLYHDNDRNLTFLPTISPSIESSKYNLKLHYPFPYLTQLSINPYLTEGNNQKPYLFSFVGTSKTSVVRKQIFELKSNNAFLLDTFDKNSWELKGKEKERYFKTYAEVLSQSLFILCPRGIGPSTYRLYEAMRLGIAPVIVSDEWLAPKGPDWDTFSIRITENRVKDIPKILNERKSEAFIMGQRAKENWEAHFSRDNVFASLLEGANYLNEQQKQLNWMHYILEGLRFFEPFHFRNLLRWKKNSMLK